MTAWVPAGDRAPPAAGFLQADPAPGPGRLLVVTDEDPASPAGSGVEMRTSALIAALRASAPTDVAPLRTIRRGIGCQQQCPRCRDDQVLIDGGLARFPLTWRTCVKAASLLAGFVRQNPYSAVLVSDFQLYRCAAAVRAASKAALIVDLHNAEADLYAEISRHPAWPAFLSPSDPLVKPPIPGGVAAVREVERQLVALADLVTMPSANDVGKLASRYGRETSFAVVPNCVPVAGAAPSRSLGRPVKCVFIGALPYFPNMLAAVEIGQTIAPAIRSAVPGMRVIVAGYLPPKPVSRALRSCPVELDGNVPDVRSLLAQAIVIVPLRVGGGTRYKILEAFAAGAPVVSTRKGIEGIDARPGAHYLPAEETADFVSAVQQIVSDPEADLRRRRAAWELVRSRYSWAALPAILREALRPLGVWEQG